MEIVTPDGRIVQASKTENEDLFWAARGSGQGFFGVVTRIWGRTIPTRRLWETTVVFDGTQSESFSEILAALFEVADRTPKHGIEMAFATFRPDRDEPGLEEEVHDMRIFVVANAVAFADTLAEAEVLLSPWTNLPDNLKKHLIATVPVEARTWDDIFDAQDKLIPYGNGERWQCDSILDRPGVAREEVPIIPPSI
jgi:FAD/FMN-containing dehydrogenase